MKQSKNRTPLQNMIIISNPALLLVGAVFYALGAGIVVYRGEPINWGIYWLGQLVIILLQLSGYYLKAYYDQLEKENQLIRRKQDPEEQGEIPARIFLLAAVTTLSIGAGVTVLLAANNAINLPTWIILGLAFGISFFYAVPPLRLANTGYGEIVSAILITNLSPALALLLQSGDLTEVLAMLTLPLTLLFLSMVLALSLEHYYQDIKEGRQNLMIRIGWQRGMNVHNLLILMAYLLVGFAAVSGLTWSLTWPLLLTLPIGIFQIWQIWSIGNGAPPRWTLLRLTALATFGITTYLITFALWIR